MDDYRNKKRQKMRARRRRAQRIKMTGMCIATLIVFIFIVFLAISNLSKIKKNVTLEAGSEINIKDFLKKENADAKFVTDVSQINTGNIGSHEIVVKVGKKEYTSKLTIEDTKAPTAKANDVTVNKDGQIEANQFVTDIKDATKVDVSFKDKPDVSKDGESEVTIVLTDEGKNQKEVKAKLTVVSDSEPPVIEGVKDITAYIGETVSYKKDVTVTDNMDQNPTLDIDNSKVNLNKAGTYEVVYTATDPIYIVFTSGSTGVPKGVVACHRSVIDYIENLSEVLCFNENTRFANQTPLYFDACLKELYPTLKFGATTYIVPKSLFMFPIKLVEFLNEYKINTVCWVVSALTMISAFKTFNKIKPEYLHTIAFGSEVFPIKQLKIWRETLPKARFVNLYGPTESTGMCCYFEVDREFELDEVVPIGRPFHNTEILLLDENNKLVEDGNVGEICVRGTSLTLGYYNNFEKTSEVFVQNPLNSRYPELIYKTGDLGKRNERGELIFVSRKDYQIKHMGHRIELGEIEVNVNMIEEISTSCAVYDKEKGKIVLYYIGELEPDKLVRILKDKLPRYMIPNKTEKLEQMPLTANGKIDRVFLMKKAQER